jgi:hypothetical protein
MGVFSAGTRHPNPRRAPYWTLEQHTAVESLKDDSFEQGIARAEHVNKVLLPDGTLSTDLAPLREAVRVAADRDFPRYRHLGPELEAMVAQKRFLFIPREDSSGGLSIIYFQCAVPGNPDLPPRKKRGRK